MIAQGDAADPDQRALDRCGRAGHRAEALHQGGKKALGGLLQKRRTVEGAGFALPGRAGAIGSLRRGGGEREHRQAAAFIGSALPAPFMVSFSTASIEGRSFEEMVLRPCSSAISGMAPFMKANSDCLMMT